MLYLMSFFLWGGEIPIVSCKLFSVHPKKTPCGRVQCVSGIGSQKNPTGHDLRKHATSLEPFLDSKHLRFPAPGSAENNPSIGRFEFVIQSISNQRLLGIARIQTTRNPNLWLLIFYKKIASSKAPGPPDGLERSGQQARTSNPVQNP